MDKDINITDDLSEGRRKKQIKKGIEKILRAFLEDPEPLISLEKIERLNTSTSGAR